MEGSLGGEIVEMHLTHWKSKDRDRRGEGVVRRG